MKVPVISKGRKILLILVTIFGCLCMTLIIGLYVDFLNQGNSINSDVMFFVDVIFFSIIIVAVTVSTCVGVISNVIIDESGITLKRGAIKSNHFSWEEIRRVETFEAMYIRTSFLTENYITVLNTNEESWAYRYRRPPTNLGKSNISFTYNSQALDLIMQYYKGEIIYS